IAMHAMTIDTGNTAFMLLCSSLVMLMTPGLAFFYGGLVGRRNVLSIMMQSFVSMGWTTVLWWAFGFSMCFSGNLKSGTDLGGILASLGVRDCAGGIVVHNIAGIAALASVLYVGTRKVEDRGPHSIPLVALGTGLLWFGWYGFNAGSEFRVDAVTAVAFLNTDIAASFAGVTWLCMDWMTSKKPKFLGLLTGAVAGLATITPAAGYVSPGTACLVGVISGI